MEWHQLLNASRRTNRKGEPSHKEPGDERTQFERDYDRVIFLSSFRRLQDKAQVFPLDPSDFVRTRLTHSIEVSTIGRSLAIDVGRRLVSEGKVDESFRPEEIATIVATTSLVHDVGNPPFGHFGESAIREWFRDGRNSKYVDLLDPEYIYDFMLFEGNAQALRILTKLQMHRHDKGVNLTYATLGSSIKYPCSSSQADSGHSYKGYTKPGYFRSESDVFEEIIGETGTGKARHPLVYLMEAADDIAYSAIDIEDAVKKGLVGYEVVLSEIIAAVGTGPCSSLVVDMEKFRGGLPEDWPEQGNTCMQELRIRAHARMIRACSDAFLANYDEIMQGQFDSALIDASDAACLYEALKRLAKKYVYNTTSVLTLECVGREVIHGLLDRFVPAAVSDRRAKPSTIEQKLYQLISPSFRYIEKSFPSACPQLYNRIQLVTDFICGMTDSYALNLYQRLTGVKI